MTDLDGQMVRSVAAAIWEAQRNDRTGDFSWLTQFYPARADGVYRAARAAIREVLCDLIDCGVYPGRAISKALTNDYSIAGADYRLYLAPESKA